MLLLLALADYAESHAEYHGLDGKVWLLAERLMGASPGPVPQNVSLWIREETGTLNGPMDTYLPNGQVSNEELSAGDQPAENAERRAETPTTTDPQSSPPVTGTISHTNGTEGFEPRPAAEQRRFSHVERVFAWQQLRHQQTAEAEKKK